MDPVFLADAIVVLHVSYVLFVIGGLPVVLLGRVLGWRWIHGRVFRWTHLLATLIVPLEAVLGLACPLTRWEGELRRDGGQAFDEIAFVPRIARKILFYNAPDHVFTACYVVFGLTVLAVFFWIPPRRGASGPRTDSTC